MRKNTAKTEEANKKTKSRVSTSTETTDSGKMEHFEHRKTVSSENVKSIQIETNNVSIRVIPSNGNEIIATFKGDSTIPGEVHLDFVQARDELDIYATLPNEGTCVNVLFVVEVPEKMYDYLRAECKYNGDVTYEHGLTAEKIKAVTLYGSIDFQEADAKKIILKAGNGSVKATIIAKSNVDINIAANGIVVAELHNFKEENVRISAIRGGVRNYMKLDGNYSLEGKISAVNGTVCLM